MTGRHGRPDAPENGTPSGRRIVKMSATTQRRGCVPAAPSRDAGRRRDGRSSRGPSTVLVTAP